MGMHGVKGWLHVLRNDDIDSACNLQQRNGSSLPLCYLGRSKGSYQQSIGSSERMLSHRQEIPSR